MNKKALFSIMAILSLCLSPIACSESDSSCTPTTCSALEHECGAWDDGCGGTLNCGTCGTHATCPTGTCVCDSGWADCDDDNSCECDLSSGSCIAGNCECTVTDTCATTSCHDGDVWCFDNCGNPDHVSEDCASGESCVGGSCSEENVIVASSCSQEDVQAAINDANDGDTVQVPEGECTWEETLVINRGIILEGQTKGCPDACNDATMIKNGADNHLIYIEPTPVSLNPYIEITGFTFDGQERAQRGIYIDTYGTPATYNNIRIHHNSFINFNPTVSGIGAIHTYGDVFGLIDHNYFYNDALGIRYSGDAARTWEHYNGGQTCTSGSPCKLNFGDLKLGSSEFMFLEDNVVVDIGYRFVSSGNAARVVARYNKETDGAGSMIAGWFDSHGIGPGTVANEFYGNSLTITEDCPRAFVNAFQYRSGTVLHHNNTIISDSDKLPPGSLFGAVDTEDQSACDASYGSDIYGYYNTLVHNGYWWDNTDDGGRLFLDLRDSKNCVSSGVDYWSDTADDSNQPQQAYTFTSGATAPETCTIGDVFWDTNNLHEGDHSVGELYKCTDTNTWTWIYSPYTYPHPLALTD